jgi:hypothetical protein
MYIKLVISKEQVNKAVVEIAEDNDLDKEVIDAYLNTKDLISYPETYPALLFIECKGTSDNQTVDFDNIDQEITMEYATIKDLKHLEYVETHLTEFK